MGLEWRNLDLKARDHPHREFPFVSRQLLKLAEERGAKGTGTLPTRRCAVIIDEAHSSQGGDAATDLKEVLGGEGLREEAARRAAEEGLEDMEEVFRSIAKRGKQLRVEAGHISGILAGSNP